MRSLSNDNFGLLIAYLLPGFVALWGLSYLSPTVHGWIAAAPTDTPTVGGFLYVTLGSTAAGLIVSVIRWAILDKVFHWTGIPEPAWDFVKLHDRLAAFKTLVEFHYRYYQYFSNMLVAILLAYFAKLGTSGSWPGQNGWADVLVLLITVVLWLGSRDTLQKYYGRVGDVLVADIGRHG